MLDMKPGEHDYRFLHEYIALQQTFPSCPVVRVRVEPRFHGFTERSRTTMSFTTKRSLKFTQTSIGIVTEFTVWWLQLKYRSTNEEGMSTPRLLLFVIGAYVCR